MAATTHLTPRPAQTLRWTCYNLLLPTTSRMIELDKARKAQAKAAAAAYAAEVGKRAPGDATRQTAAAAVDDDDEDDRDDDDDELVSFEGVKWADGRVRTM